MAKKISGVGVVLHVGLVNMTVAGEGELKTSLLSNAGASVNLLDYTLQANPDRMAALLANFQKQKIQVSVGTIDIGESFQLNNIVVFVAPVAAGYPM